MQTAFFLRLRFKPQKLWEPNPNAIEKRNDDNEKRKEETALHTFGFDYMVLRIGLISQVLNPFLLVGSSSI
jgi:hypothetical protein